MSNVSIAKKRKIMCSSQRACLNDVPACHVSQGPITSVLEQNGFQLMHNPSFVERITSSDEVLSVRNFSADQRVKYKQDGLEHGNSVIDDGFSSVGQDSGPSSKLSNPFHRIDSVKDASRCRDRYLYEGPSLNMGDAFGKRRRLSVCRIRGDSVT